MSDKPTIPLCWHCSRFRGRTFTTVRTEAGDVQVHRQCASDAAERLDKEHGHGE